MTTAKIEIRDSKFSDINQLCASIRDKDRIEIERMGYASPRKALISAFKHSVIRKTALVNGRIAAMFGVCGQITSEKGYPYFITGIHVEDATPLQVARAYKLVVEEMVQVFPKLEGTVDHAYPEAVRLLKMAGFKIGKPFYAGREENLFYKFTYD